MKEREEQILSVLLTTSDSQRFERDILDDVRPIEVDPFAGAKIYLKG